VTRPSCGARVPNHGFSARPRRFPTHLSLPIVICSSKVFEAVSASAAAPHPRSSGSSPWVASRRSSPKTSKTAACKSSRDQRHRSRSGTNGGRPRFLLAARTRAREQEGGGKARRFEGFALTPATADVARPFCSLEENNFCFGPPNKNCVLVPSFPPSRLPVDSSRSTNATE
jgi:hypothetical protein